ncbi:hypothetical protein ACFY7Z_06490 [Streptomyces sp. NPDC012623]|uniref:hypothetical protein n=1 Tax=unclassified Streptomyces TaxID=2593676 RepID=UPI00368368C0
MLRESTIGLFKTEITIPDDMAFRFPRRARNRPAFGFRHACFELPLTAIYAARAVPDASGSTRSVLADHPRRQCEHLDRTSRDSDPALGLIGNEDLRARLNAVYRTTRLAQVQGHNGYLSTSSGRPFHPLYGDLWTFAIPASFRSPYARLSDA